MNKIVFLKIGYLLMIISEYMKESAYLLYNKITSLYRYRRDCDRNVSNNITCCKTKALNIILGWIIYVPAIKI